MGAGSQKGNNMKATRLISGLMAPAVIFSLCACDMMPGNTSSPSDTAPADTTPSSVETSQVTETTKPDLGYGTGDEIIRLWSYDNKLPDIMKEFCADNKDFSSKYTVEVTVIDIASGYNEKLDEALTLGSADAPDIYATDSDHVYRYTQGDMAQYASTYRNLGIDVDGKINKASIAPYILEAGKRDGEIVALGYQSNGCALIYRASIAKEVFGSDEPEKIAPIVGSGSGSWNKFLEASKKLKDKGYAAVSGQDDIWIASFYSSKTSWVVNGQVHVDDKRAGFFDISKKLRDDELTNKNTYMSDGWFKDMQGEGEKGVFAFFGSYQMINDFINNEAYCPKNSSKEGTYGDWRVCRSPVDFYLDGEWLLANKRTQHGEGVAAFLEWATLDTSAGGLQYLLACGKTSFQPGKKVTVASGTVMETCENPSAFFGDQDVYPVFTEASQKASFHAWTEDDDAITKLFLESVDKYVNDESEEEADTKKENATNSFRRSAIDYGEAQGKKWK